MNYFLIFFFINSCIFTFLSCMEADNSTSRSRQLSNISNITPSAILSDKHRPLAIDRAVKLTQEFAVSVDEETYQKIISDLQKKRGFFQSMIGPVGNLVTKIIPRKKRDLKNNPVSNTSNKIELTLAQVAILMRDLHYYPHIYSKEFGEYLLHLDNHPLLDIDTPEEISLYLNEIPEKISGPLAVAFHELQFFHTLKKMLVDIRHRDLLESLQENGTGETLLFLLNCDPENTAKKLGLFFEKCREVITPVHLNDLEQGHDGGAETFLLEDFNGEKNQKDNTDTSQPVDPINADLFSFYVSLDIHPTVKEVVSKEFKVTIERTILKKVGDAIQKQKNRNELIEILERSPGDRVTLTLSDIANYLMPHLCYYPRRMCAEHFAMYLFNQHNHPLLDMLQNPEEISLYLNEIPEKISGPLAFAINIIRLFHILYSMGVTLHHTAVLLPIAEDDEGETLLFFLNCNPDLVQKLAALFDRWHKIVQSRNPPELAEWMIIEGKESYPLKKLNVKKERQHDIKDTRETITSVPSFFSFYMPLAIDSRVKKIASKQFIVPVEKTVLQELYDEIKKQRSIPKLIKKLENSSGDTVKLTLNDIAYYLMPYLNYYPRKVCTDSFAQYVYQFGENHPLLDLSDELALQINGELKLIKGPLALAIHELHFFHTLAIIGVEIHKDPSLFEEHDKSTLLFFLNCNHDMATKIGTFLENCRKVVQPNGKKKNKKETYPKEGISDFVLIGQEDHELVNIDAPARLTH